MTNDQLIEALYQINAVKFGEFTLKSGNKSNIYLDLRQIVSYPDVLRSVANAIWKKICSCHFELICGVPYTALPIATCISIMHNIPMIMRRKEKKDYGTKQQIEGKFHTGQHCLIVEDVITTGGSILETSAELEEAGLVVKDLVVLINREHGGKASLERKNYRVFSVFTLREIMEYLLKTEMLSQEERAIVNNLLSGNQT